MWSKILNSLFSDVYTVGSSHSAELPALDIGTPDDVHVRVCFYGETEEASVRLTPDSFESDDLIVNESFVYTFNIKNNSKDLPITYLYNKVPYIEMKPPKLSLGPQGSVDVNLILTPKKMGKMEKNIIINLLFTNKDGETYNVGTTQFHVCYKARMVLDRTKPPLWPKFVKGITPDCTNEVGYLVDDVKFNTDIAKPIMAVVNPKYKSFHKRNSALIAFPNDRSRSLRPQAIDIP